jgi:hypothetical protein
VTRGGQQEGRRGARRGDTHCDPREKRQAGGVGGGRGSGSGSCGRGTQLTEVKSAKPAEEALEGLAEEEGTNGSFPLNGSPNPFLFWNGSPLSAPSGWNGSGGSGMSAEPSWLTGVLLPGKCRRNKTKQNKKQKQKTKKGERKETSYSPGTEQSVEQGPSASPGKLERGCPSGTPPRPFFCAWRWWGRGPGPHLTTKLHPRTGAKPGRE